MQRRLSAAGVALVAAFLWTPAGAVECFSMFNAKNALVYQSSTSPIDLSRSISDQMARSFPARYLVISEASTCSVVGATVPANAAALLPSRGGFDTDGSVAGSATSPAPISRTAQAGPYDRGDGTAVQSYTRSPPRGRR